MSPVRDVRRPSVRHRLTAPNPGARAVIYPTFLGGPETSTMVYDIGSAILAVAAGIAIAGGLIGTGLAQSGIGAAGMGIIAEKPEKFGQVLFFFVIPETLWIIGFVLGIILLLHILG
jgi:V/A-type H+/Na+-transporting ATPase subunit K